jgi:hypothetical protein
MVISRRRNQDGTERTLTALRELGRLEPVDAGEVALARHLAWCLDTVDAQRYPAQTASLARSLADVLRSLRGVSAGEDTSAADAILAALQAEVGDSSQP